jgi:VWFA-related protein
MKLSAWLRSTVELCGFVLVSALCSYAQQARPSDQPFTIQVDVNRVLVPVVVRDKQGHAVGDLKREDFQVFDNGKPLPILAFAIERSALPASNAQMAIPNATASQAQPAPGTQRFIVFLFDDMHLTVEDLVHAQEAGAKVVTGSLAPRDIADVVSLSGKSDSGLTRDKARLQDTIKSMRVNNLYRSDGGECPNINYYLADQMIEKRSDAAMRSAIQLVFACSPGMDQVRDLLVAQHLAEMTAQRVLAIGQMDAQSTYTAIQNLVRRIAHLPGQRILILVSPGFLSIDNKSLTAESHIIQLAAQSGVVINSLDARGLYTSEMQASDRSSGSPESDQLLADYRRTGAMQSGDAMASLADGTGGTFFHNSNDLASGLTELTTAPEYTYILEISPKQAKPDGNYHSLKVTLDRDGMRLQARRGYFEPKPEKAKK